MVHPNLSRYLCWTLGISFAVGLPVAAASHGLLAVDLPSELMLVLLVSPAVVAIGLVAAGGGSAAVRLLLWRQGLRPPARWWVVALITPFAINAVALLAHAIGGGTPPELPGAPAPEQQVVPVWLLPLVFIAYSAAEEAGWRRYALPRLQARTSALTASVLLGLVWAVWHLPLHLVAGSTQGSIGYPSYVVGTIATSVVFTWLYNSSGGSLATVVLLHASAQASYVVLPVLPSVTGATTTYELAVTAKVLLAIVLIATFGARELSRSPRQTDGPTTRPIAPMA
jgi:uncharacterized protein